MARPIMIQGTMSNAGKSLLAAGLCRIFHQDGYRTAPFKSQNMALNSYITADGLEMGRAQAVQAEAAGILPETAMNPILLKPTSHTGSQVIVNGRVLGNYPASQYYKMKGQLIPHVLRAYESLASRFDIIVIEGAGSPAEINLRENDFVNMGLAKMVDAPVLLAGDIDRGGVFAQLYGTAALLSKEERQRIRGFIINKFRGDKELLRPGLSMLYERIPIPVAGVVPYMDIDLDDEDSLADRLSSTGKDCLDSNGNHAFAKIAVLRLPRISNFTEDFQLYGFSCAGAASGDRASVCVPAGGTFRRGSDLDPGDKEYHGRSEMDERKRTRGGCFAESGSDSGHGNLRRISDAGRDAYGSRRRRRRRRDARHGTASGFHPVFQKKDKKPGHGYRRGLWEAAGIWI